MVVDAAGVEGWKKELATWNVHAVSTQLPNGSYYLYIPENERQNIGAFFRHYWKGDDGYNRIVLNAATSTGEGGPWGNLFGTGNQNESTGIGFQNQFPQDSADLLAVSRFATEQRGTASGAALPEKLTAGKVAGAALEGASQGAAVLANELTFHAIDPLNKTAEQLIEDMKAMKFPGLTLRLTVARLILFGGVAILQDRFIYFPEKAATEDVVSGGLRPWPTPEVFRGLVAEPAGSARATAIVFHGNAGHAGHRSFYAAALTRLGLRVILAEYPGYGPRDGTPGEERLVADAQQTIALTHRHYSAPLLLVGESLGAGVAAAAGSRERDKTAGLLLITPWDRLEHVAAYHYPWLPVKWLLRDRYDSVTHLASFGRPVLVVVAERDSIVPPHFGEALYNSLAEPRQLMV